MADHLFDSVNVYCDLAGTHGGKLKVAKEMVEQVLAAGGVPKIQLFNEETWPWKWLKELKGVPFVPSVFRPADVGAVVPFKPLALKVASVEATYAELVSECMQTELPLIVSTGGLNTHELTDLMEQVNGYVGRVCLMHCVSKYPTPKVYAHLLRIGYLMDLADDFYFDVEVGWSAHGPDSRQLAAAMGLGVTQIEVHVRPNLIPQTEDEHSALCLIPPISTVKKGTFDPRPASELFSELNGFMNDVRYMLDVLGPEWTDEMVPPDREQVLKWRERWTQTG